MDFDVVTSWPGRLPHALAQFNPKLQDLTARLGQPHSEDCGGLEAGWSDVWIIKFSCGMIVLVQYSRYLKVVVAYANRPEIDHVVRHLRLGEPTWRLDQAHPESLGEVDGEFALVRQDDNGHRYLIAQGLMLGDAECRLAEFEKGSHKQTYFVEPMPVSDAIR